MKQLLDTHTFLWFVMGDAKITPGVRLQIEDNHNFLSIVSVWEIAIKYSIGKLSLGVPFNDFIDRQITPNGIELLEIKLEHLKSFAALPLHHRDPFDRLLIAQALVEKNPIVSIDIAFDAYPIQRIW
ncbi:type II toxin-antitoxin system VapC family toxin [Microcoleus sp. herbarium19]|uniref:type II toxin-antitoxin system VapC family toxin n=1 Tax=unclassified Microcoleus TaxID=2642155 RepID=UPI002FCF55CB